MKVKIFINNMRTQNIFNFYGYKFDLKLDNSEFYDYQITDLDDYEKDILDFSVPKSYLSLVFESDCLTPPLNDNIPLKIEVDVPFISNNCDFTIKSRTEKGWTLDFVFNQNEMSWHENNTFYYWGIENETDIQNYADNNLSFSFTTDKEILWEKKSCSGNCDPDEGFNITFNIETGKTNPLCLNDFTNDFNVTITFERYNEYSGCQLLNEGGLNDMISGYSVTNVLDVISGATANYELIQILNEKWINEKGKRLGDLKIYINGRVIYKISNWEEVIPSKRESENLLLQIWGGGTDSLDELHVGTTQFILKNFKYFNEPLNFVNVKHHFITKISPLFNISDCGD